MPPPDKKRKRLLEEDLLESKRSRDGGRARSPIARYSQKMLLNAKYRCDIDDAVLNCEVKIIGESIVNFVTFSPVPYNYNPIVIRGERARGGGGGGGGGGEGGGRGERSRPRSSERRRQARSRSPVSCAAVKYKGSHH